MDNKSPQQLIETALTSLVSAYSTTPKPFDMNTAQVMPVAEKPVAIVPEFVFPTPMPEPLNEIELPEPVVVLEEPSVNLREEVLAEIMAVADEIAAAPDLPVYTEPEPFEAPVVLPDPITDGAASSPSTADLVAQLNSLPVPEPSSADSSGSVLDDFDPVRYLAGGNSGNVNPVAVQSASPSVAEPSVVGGESGAEDNSGAPRDQRQILQMLGELRSLRD